LLLFIGNPYFSLVGRNLSSLKYMTNNVLFFSITERDGRNQKFFCGPKPKALSPFSVNLVLKLLEFNAKQAHEILWDNIFTYIFQAEFSRLPRVLDFYPNFHLRHLVDGLDSSKLIEIKTNTYIKHAAFQEQKIMNNFS